MRIDPAVYLKGLHLFGCPRPGCQPLVTVLLPVPISNWRNGDKRSHDFVTNVPFNLPGLPYLEPAPFIPVSAPPPPGDSWGLFAWHHMSLYRQGLADGLTDRPLEIAMADLLLDLYHGTGKWDLITEPQQSDGICMALKHMEGWDAVVFRGSTTFGDWARDFMAGTHALEDHPTLGPLHQGFALGLDRAFELVVPHLEQPVRVGGHSLGAARAAIFTGLLVLALQAQ